MDTSKEYILMCEKAKEIQEIKPIESDCGFHYRDLPNRIHWVNDGQCYFEELFNNKIWLPRQDQLQEMLGSHTTGELCHAIDTYYAGNLPEIRRLKSMEQLWFAYVMKEKYSKQWDGKDWIKV